MFMTDSAGSGKSRQGIQSIEVGVRLLQVLVAEGRAMMLRDLAQAAGMPAAKAHRYLVSFSRAGLICQDPVSGRYDLGAFALGLGLSGIARLDPVRLATPVMDDLAEVLGETVALAVWGNLGPTIVRWVEAPRPVSVNLRVGAVMPLLHSATGLAFAAFGRSATLEKRIDEALAQAAHSVGGGQPRSRAELDAVLAEARRHGLARAVGSVLPGINAFSAPVFDYEGQMSLALTTLGPAGTVPPDWDGSVPQRLRAAALRLSQQLGWRAAPEAL
jgi:DNA-binding IclR family transcriptional regulator